AGVRSHGRRRARGQGTVRGALQGRRHRGGRRRVEAATGCGRRRGAGMSEVSAAQVRELREKTGAGIMDCKRALAEGGGNLDKAVVYLREKGLAAAAKKSARAASEGVVGSYIHAGGKIGVLIEVNCETDFVARTPEFQTLVKDLAMQVAAANPHYVRREDVPPATLESERGI